MKLEQCDYQIIADFLDANKDEFFDSIMTDGHVDNDMDAEKYGSDIISALFDLASQ